MRRLAVWGIGAAVLLMLSLAAATAADDDDDVRPASRSRTWPPPGGLLMPSKKKPPAKTEKDKSKTGDADKRAAGTTQRSGMADTALALREQEMAKLLRRQEVCLKLHQVARDTNNADLERLATQLDQRAWDVYRDRTSRLPGATTALEEDEKRLEHQLPVKSRETTRLMPRRDRSITAEDLSSTAAVREVEP